MHEVVTTTHRLVYLAGMHICPSIYIVRILHSSSTAPPSQHPSLGMPYFLTLYPQPEHIRTLLIVGDDHILPVCL